MGYIEKIEGNNSLKAGVGMNVNELKKIIESGEKINVEFKLSENDLTKDVFPLAPRYKWLSFHLYQISVV